MSTTNRYITRLILMPLLAALALILSLLFLERLIRLLEEFGQTEGAFEFLFEMLINLIPHFLGSALPLSLFFGIYLAFARLSADSEVTVMNAVGLSSRRLINAPLVFTLLFTLIAAATYGYMQPYGRYAYRAFKYLASHASISAAIQAGAFLEVKDWTILVERADPASGTLGKIFIHERKADGATATITAKSGSMSSVTDSRDSVIYLSDGLAVIRSSADAPPETPRFGDFTWRLNVDDISGFRNRGADERELTVDELWNSRNGPPAGMEAGAVQAELHSRLVRIASMLIVPFLTIPLATGSRRNRSRVGATAAVIGFLFGFIILAGYHYVLVLGEGFVDAGLFGAFTALWLPAMLFAAGALLLFWRTVRSVGGDPVVWLSETVVSATERLVQPFVRSRDSAA